MMSLNVINNTILEMPYFKFIIYSLSYQRVSGCTAQYILLT